MNKASLPWLKKLAATSVIAALLVIPAIQSAQAQLVGFPTVPFVDVTPDPYNPNEGVLDIDWTISNQSGWVEVDILNNSGTKVHQPQGQTFMDPGSHDVAWNGKIDGEPAPAGTYTARVKTWNGINTDNPSTNSENFQLTYAGDVAPVITNQKAEPSPFNPNVQGITVSYTQNTTADIEIVIRNSVEAVVDTIVDVNDRTAGTWSKVWDGKKNNGEPFEEGTYHFGVKATNSAGQDNRGGSFVIDYDVDGQVPEITSHDVNPDEFDPDEESARIEYTVDQSVRTTVRIEELDGTVIRTLANNENINAGSESELWNGRNNSGILVGEDTYRYRITVTNDNGSDSATGFVEVDYDIDGGNVAPQITNDRFHPDPFDPDEEDSTLRFTLNTRADVTIEIEEENGLLVKRLKNDVDYGKGSHAVNWDGRDRFSDKVDDDVYVYRITAENNFGDDEEEGDVEVDRDGTRSGNLIDNITVRDRIFDPRDGERTQICFDILQDNTDISLEVIRSRSNSSNTAVRVLLDDVEFDEQDDRCYTWDGRDRFGNNVQDGDYEFRLRAERGSETEVEFEFIEVDSDGIRTNTGDCGGFTDVYRDSPLCRAIELMYFRGIFSGYPDGTFRPYAEINRAEATKVILLALDYNVRSDRGNAGFWDVISGAWYSPYLNTARDHGVIDGYPDRSFRPEGYVNRVELLKIFLEAADVNVPACSFAPYRDTPVNGDTRWYIDYVCFAKTYGLMKTDEFGNFNPGEPMTRGDVADLFYQFERRGLPYDSYDRYYDDRYYDDRYYDDRYYDDRDRYDDRYDRYDDRYYDDRYDDRYYDNRYNDRYDRYDDRYDNRYYDDRYDYDYDRYYYNYNTYDYYNNSYYEYY